MFNKLLIYLRYSLLLILINIVYVDYFAAETLDIKNLKYRLGVGDKLSINISQFESFNSIVNILPDGTVNLPRIDSISLNGLTLDQAKYKIQESYKKVLINPIIYIDLKETRDIKFSILGEIKKPGFYYISNNNAKNYWPTIFDAIEKSGGIKPEANIKNIKVIRKGENEFHEFTFNLWKNLKEKTQETNYNIYDGDKIFISKNETYDENLTSFSTESNLTTSEINVTVIGEILYPGTKTLKNGTTLNNALLISGGLTLDANNNKIELLRPKDNGYVERKFYKYNKKLIEKNNPLLNDGDIIFVQSNKWGKLKDRIGNISEPALNILRLNRITEL